MTKIIGVDFSGAQSDKNTWMTECVLRGQDLEIRECRCIRRNELTGYLESLSGDAIVALDFPFGVPVDFADFLEYPGCEMPTLWKAAADMCLNEFIDKRNDFVGDDKTRELLRAGDIRLTGCFSCLHDTNPNMIPMTFYGMKMLNRLWEFGCKVPPLTYSKDSKGPLLLEIMPGAALQSLGLPRTNSGKAYKKKDAAAINRRREILDNLACEFRVNLLNFTGENYEKCMEIHDCLDSTVAAASAAVWAIDKPRFQRPDDTRKVGDTIATSSRKARLSPTVKEMTELQAARREGWIYVPQRIP